MDQKLKAVLSIVAVVLLVSLTVLVNVLIANYSKEGEFIGLDSVPTIQVKGEGEMSVVPDLMQLSFSVVTTDDSSEGAITANNEKMERVMDYLRSESVDDVKTGSFSLYPLYEYSQESGKREIYGYEVVNVLEVKLRDFEKASYVIDGAVRAGANRVDSFNLLVENEENYKEEAREIAIQEARSKAERTAQSLGLKVGRVVGFSEEDSYYYPVMREMAADSKVPVEVGENKITVTVRVEYEVKQK